MESIGASDIPSCGRKVILDRIVGSDVGDLSQIIIKKKGNVFERIPEEALEDAGILFYTQGKVRGKGHIDDFVATLDIVIPVDKDNNVLKGSKIEDQEKFEEMLSSTYGVWILELKTTGAKPSKSKYLEQVCAQRMVLNQYTKVMGCKLLVSNLNSETKEFDIPLYELDNLEEKVTEKIIERTDALYCHRTNQDYELPSIQISGLCMKHCAHVDSCPAFTNGSTVGIDKITEDKLHELKLAIDENKKAFDNVERLKDEFKEFAQNFQDEKGKFPTLKGKYLQANVSGNKDKVSLPRAFPPKLDKFLKKKFPKVSIDTASLKDSSFIERLEEKYGEKTKTPMRISFKEI